LLSFERNATIEGFPVTALKAILRSIDRTGTIRSAENLQGTGLTRLQNAIATEVAVQAGLLDRHQQTLTDLGQAVAGSTSKPRLAKTKAAKILAELLQSAARCNADPDVTHNISEIWLFGSHARGADTVGDIDLIITWERKPHLTFDEAEKMIFAQYTAQYIAWANPWDMQTTILSRHLFGVKRNSAISATTNIDLLISMAEPCMKIFDIANGIIDDPQLLDKHPKATVRSDSMRTRIAADDRDRLLTFKPSPNFLRATFSCGERGYWDPNPGGLEEFWTLDRQVYTLSFRGNQANRGLKVFTHADASELRYSQMDALPETFDGWALALIVTDFRCFTLKRRIETSEGDRIALHVELHETEHRGAPRAKLTTRDRSAYSEIIGIYLAMLTHHDLRCLEALSSGKPKLSVSFSTPEYDKISRFAETYLEHLTADHLQTQEEDA